MSLNRLTYDSASKSVSNQQCFIFTPDARILIDNDDVTEKYTTKGKYVRFGHSDEFKVYGIPKYKNGVRELHKIIYGIYGNPPEGISDNFTGIHHKNGNPYDNNITNLIAFEEAIDHTRWHMAMNLIKDDSPLSFNASISYSGLMYYIDRFSGVAWTRKGRKILFEDLELSGFSELRNKLKKINNYESKLYMISIPEIEHFNDSDESHYELAKRITFKFYVKEEI